MYFFRHPLRTSGFACKTSCIPSRGQSLVIGSSSASSGKNKTQNTKYVFHVLFLPSILELERIPSFYLATSYARGLIILSSSKIRIVKVNYGALFCNDLSWAHGYFI